MIKDYRGMSWESLQPLVEINEDLNSLFSESDPDIIADKLLNGLNQVIKELIIIKRVQLNSKAAPYWNSELEDSRTSVKTKMRTAHITGNIEDERDAKNARNIHSRKIKKRITEYYKDKFSKDKNKFKSVKEIQEIET